MKRLLVVVALWLVAIPASAATMTFIESGTDATFDLSFYTTTNGTISSSTTHVNTGPRAILCDTGSPAATSAAQAPTGILADAGRRVSFWVYITAAPAASNTIASTVTSGGSLVWSVNLNTDRTVSWLMVGATAATSGTAIALNTWTRVTISYTITNTTTFRLDLYLDGVNQGSATAGTATRTGTSAFQFRVNSALGTNYQVWFDDLYIDDGADYSDPGDIRVTAKRPNANGATNNYDTSTTTTNSGYGTGNSIYVNERALATTGQRRHNANSGPRVENFNIENAATGDVNLTSATIVARSSWVHASGVSTDTIYDNGSASVPSTAISGTAGIRWLLTTSATYPSTSGTVGMGRPTASTTDAILNECGMLIAYTPATVTCTPTLSLFGVGRCG